MGDYCTNSDKSQCTMGLEEKSSLELDQGEGLGCGNGWKGENQMLWIVWLCPLNMLKLYQGGAFER